jgi:hypothetical protein
MALAGLIMGYIATVVGIFVLVSFCSLSSMTRSKIEGATRALDSDTAESASEAGLNP